MAFKDKTDWFGLAGNGLVVVEDDDGRAASTAQAHNEKGDVVAFEVFGETMSPTCTYNLSSNVSMGSLKCGQPFTVGDKKFTLGQLTINTTAGSAPTV